MIRTCLALLVTGLAVFVVPAEEPGASPPLVRVLHFDGMIHPASARAFTRALREAEARHAELLLVELNTPGGFVTSTRDIAAAILASKLPVCVYVTPRAAQAASGGFFVLLAADVAAMAPVTTTGAAHPITGSGHDTEEDIGLKKASEDLSALVRSAARMRGRPQELAEAAVRDAKAWNAEEALELGLIDHIAANRDELLAWLDGREIKRPDGSVIVLDLAGARIEEHHYEWKEEFAKILLQPWVMGMLLTIGMLGIYIEFQHPGLILPGIAGVLCLLIFAWGSQVLPVSFLGVALIALAMVLFILEIKVASFGMLTLGGVACLGAGLWILFPRDIPGLEISWMSMLPPLILAGFVVGFVSYLVAKAQRQRVTTGREGMPGLVGEVTRALDPMGTIFVHGEYWSALAEGPIETGARVRVIRVDGLSLFVERAADNEGHAGELSAREGELS